KIRTRRPRTAKTAARPAMCRFVAFDPFPRWRRAYLSRVEADWGMRNIFRSHDRHKRRQAPATTRREQCKKTGRAAAPGNGMAHDANFEIARLQRPPVT